MLSVNFFVKNISAETTYGSIVLPAETRLSNTRMGPRRLNRGTIVDSVYITQFFCVEVLGHCPDPVFGFCHTDPHIAPVFAIFWSFAHFFVFIWPFARNVPAPSAGGIGSGAIGACFQAVQCRIFYAY